MTETDQESTVFCGNSQFWNSTLLEDNWYPEFTKCFQLTALTYIPCGWLWLTSVFHVAYLQGHTKFISLPNTWIHRVRLVFAVSLCLMSVVHLLIPTQSKSTYPAAFYTSEALWLVTYMLASFLMVLSRKSGVSSPCVVFLFWFLALVTRIIPIYSFIFQKVYDVEEMRFYAELVTFTLLVLEFGFQLASDTDIHLLDEDSSHKPSPVMRAPFFSKLTYSWMLSMVYQGYKRVVVLTDIFELPPYMQCQHNVPAFTAAWQKEQRKKTTKKRMENGTLFNSIRYANGSAKLMTGREDDHDEVSEKTQLLPKPRQSVCDQVPVMVNQGKPSLIKALAKVFFLPLFKAQMVGLIADAVLYLNPIVLGLLIDYVEDKESYPEWRGYILAVCLFLVVVVSSMLSNFRFYNCNNVGQRVRTVLTAAVYKKSLTMNSESRRKFTVGNIVNLMSVDCARFRDTTAQLYAMFSWPVQITIAFYMLNDVLGYAFLVGLAFVILLIPTNAFISTKLKRVQRQQIGLKDQRLRLINEILNGVKVLKLYAWEPSFQEKILKVRQQESVQLKMAAKLAALTSLCFLVAPVMMTVSCFVAYVLITGESLTPSTAFVAMSIFNTMKAPMNNLPNLISQLVECQVSLRRLEDYLLGEDLDDAASDTTSEDFPISMRNATFTWDRTMNPVLPKITLKIPRGKLVAIVGQVGAGKSSLLSAMLREMEQVTGESSLSGHVAYVPQQAWIQNMTLQSNILFEKPMAEKFYKTVVEACALNADIELLPAGELTEIGEKGINLSGGQKQRISLARAVYQEADIYLLDDPLSAVDAHVGKHIFQKVISAKGLLHNKTRVMVTHGVHWLPMVDAIIVMDQGRITEAGSYEELMTHDGPFAQFVRTYLLEHQDDELDDPEVRQMQDEILQKVESVTSDEEQALALRRSFSDHGGYKPRSRTSSRSSNKSLKGSISACEVKGLPDLKNDRLIEEEKVEEGEVRSAVFRHLIRSFGFIPVAAVCVFLLVYNGANIAAGLWLSEWTDDPYLANETNANNDDYMSKTYLYLGVYTGVSSLQMFSNGAFVMLVYVQMVVASQRMHNVMLNTILHQTMAFFDTTPLGRILNRFSRDVDVCDANLGRQIRLVLQNFFTLCVVIIIISYTTPIFLVVVGPVLIIYVLFQRFYIPSSRQFRRLDSTTRSPIFSHFAETIGGVSTIRAYNACDRFYQDSQDKVDTNTKCAFAADSAARWLKVRLEFLGSLLVFFASLFAILSNDMSPSLVGLSITYALQVTGALNMLVQNITMLETNSVSVERIVEYINLPHEPSWTIPEKKPSNDWPAQGKISFTDYSTRYRPQLDLVLCGISFTARAGQKIGIVGRTGAGKSSLSMALFRMIEAAGGSISIDNVDISEIGLHDLRQGLTILPQDPVLFCGTVRFNLDPFDHHSDAAIWEALDHAHMSVCIRELPGQLAHVCEEGGQNLSVGQRQLMCLARSLLRKSRILVLDEATAAVDLETDALIQETIRTAFSDCTVLTVAHRLNTVLDYDMILVLSNGKIQEFDSPTELLRNTAGTFYSMAKESGLVL